MSLVNSYTLKRFLDRIKEYEPEILKIIIESWLFILDDDIEYRYIIDDLDIYLSNLVKLRFLIEFSHFINQNIEEKVNFLKKSDIDEFFEFERDPYRANEDLGDILEFNENNLSSSSKVVLIKFYQHWVF